MTPARRAEFERLVDALEDTGDRLGAGQMESVVEDAAAYDAARAALTAFVEAEEGEVYEVERHDTVGLDGWYGANAMWLPAPPAFRPGDRVRVQKVEEAE